MAGRMGLQHKALCAQIVRAFLYRLVNLSQVRRSGRSKLNFNA